jgi:predicted TIM-barrel fold metal-dependent hydrolase
VAVCEPAGEIKSHQIGLVRLTSGQPPLLCVKKEKAIDFKKISGRRYSGRIGIPLFLWIGMSDGTKGVTLVSITFFDAHFHIFDPRFPLKENQGFLPDAFTCLDYLNRTKKWNVIGGAVVSGSFQGFDQSYLMEALKTLGPTFVGVTQLPHDISDEDIIWLHECGVRAVRINVQRGGFESLFRLEYVANRLYELVGWHVELYVDSRFLSELFSLLVRLPAVSIDHLGLSEEGFPLLLKLVEKGIRVKATGFGRVNLRVEKAIRSICEVNPDALMFGTDLPSTRAKRPFQDTDLDIIFNTLDEKLAEKVLFQNAVDWYRPSGIGV